MTPVGPAIWTRIPQTRNNRLLLFCWLASTILLGNGALAVTIVGGAIELLLGACHLHDVGEDATAICQAQHLLAVSVSLAAPVEADRVGLWLAHMINHSSF